MSKALRLSIALAAMLVALPASAASLINNGSFEQLSVGALNGLHFGQSFNTLGTGDGNQNWDVYSTLPGGWYTTSDDPAGFEVQTNPTLTTTDAHGVGTHYIELESHPDNPSASNILQDFTVAAGDAGLYMLSFYYQPRTEVEGDNLINAIFGGFTTTVSGPPDPAFGDWTLIEVFANLAVGLHTLEFNAFGTLIDNTYGGFIDSVSVDLIKRDDNPIVPLPAGLILLLSGLGGLGFLSRARAKTA